NLAGGWTVFLLQFGLKLGQLQLQPIALLSEFLDLLPASILFTGERRGVSPPCHQRRDALIELLEPAEQRREAVAFPAGIALSRCQIVEQAAGEILFEALPGQERLAVAGQQSSQEPQWRVLRCERRALQAAEADPQAGSVEARGRGRCH